MTTPTTAWALALIAASQARIAGMQSANAHRQLLGLKDQYDPGAFFEEAARMETVAREVLENQP